MMKIIHYNSKIESLTEQYLFLFHLLSFSELLSVYYSDSVKGCYLSISEKPTIDFELLPKELFYFKMKYISFSNL